MRVIESAGKLTKGEGDSQRNTIGKWRSGMKQAEKGKRRYRQKKSIKQLRKSLSKYSRETDFKIGQVPLVEITFSLLSFFFLLRLFFFSLSAFFYSILVPSYSFENCSSERKLRTDNDDRTAKSVQEFVCLLLRVVRRVKMVNENFVCFRLYQWIMPGVRVKIENQISVYWKRN